MAKSLITVPSRVYQPGSRMVNLPNLTTDDNGVKIALTRESWSIGTGIISGVIEGSNDGAEWNPITTFSYDVGVITNTRTGQTVLTCGPTCYWPETYINGVATPQRPAQVRATITNTLALQTAITLSGV